MNEQLRALALGLLLLMSSMFGTLLLAGSATAATDASCKTSATHDAFLTDNATIEQAVNGSASTTAMNTRITVENPSGFARLQAENPNNYCVAVTVQISDRIVQPAELGQVDAVSSNVTAEWRAIADYEQSETYTQVEFVLPANAQVTFAPSDARIQTLAWTAKAKEAGGGLLSGFQSTWDDIFGDDLEKKTYVIDAPKMSENSSASVSLSLRNSTDGRVVTDRIMYSRASDGESWGPLTKDPDAAVFYHMTNKHTIEFIFNDPDAQVKFIANPTWVQKRQHGWDSWSSGWGDIGDRIGVDVPEFDLPFLAIGGLGASP